jgi:uncharacterized protein
MSQLVVPLLGYGFLALGLIGLLAPVMPGWILIFVGLFLLAKHASWARRALDWFRGRHPRLRAVIDRAESLVTRWTRLVRVRVGRLLRPAER